MFKNNLLYRVASSFSCGVSFLVEATLYMLFRIIQEIEEER